LVLNQSKSTSIIRAIRWKRVIAVLIISFLTPIIVLGWRKAYFNYFETVPPKITILDVPKGLSNNHSEVAFYVEDSTSGLASVAVWLEQNGKRLNLGSTTEFSDPKTKQKFNIPLPNGGNELRQGEATLFIEATDASMWNAGALETIRLLVDYEAPLIEVKHYPPLISTGQVALALFTLHDDHPSKCDAYLTKPKESYRSLVMPCFPASKLDSKVISSSLYTTILTVPLDAPEQSLFELILTDKVGNTTSVILPTKTEKINNVPIEVSISTELFKKKIRQDFDAYRIFTAKQQTKTNTHESVENLKPSELMSITSQLSESYVHAKLSQSRESRYWNSPFLRQPATVAINFNEILQYNLSEATYSLASSTGEIIELPLGQEQVSALQDGFVIAAENIGIYHEAVIIDHGLGISTLYGNLKATTVVPGSLIHKGDVVGYAREGPSIGSSVNQKSSIQINPTNEIQEKSQAIIEIRINGIPVTPAPWFNDIWINENFDNLLLKSYQLN